MKPYFILLFITLGIITKMVAAIPLAISTMIESGLYDGLEDLGLSWSDSIKGIVEAKVSLLG